MKISVIIPCYNQGEYLPDAIDSVLAQTIAAHEIIVIDDGSTDKTLEIAKSYESKGIKIVSQVNKGLPGARNAGIMNATGDYILPLDADDILLETCIEKLTEAAIKTDSDVIGPSFNMFGYRTGSVILDQIPSIEDFKTANRLPYFCAVKRSVFLEVGGYNPKMKWGWEDLDLWFDIFKRKHSVCLLGEVLVLYRTKPHSMIDVANEHSGELSDQIRRNHKELFV